MSAILATVSPGVCGSIHARLRLQCACGRVYETRATKAKARSYLYCVACRPRGGHSAPTCTECDAAGHNARTCPRARRS